MIILKTCFGNNLLNEHTSFNDFVAFPRQNIYYFKNILSSNAIHKNI